MPYGGKNILFLLHTTDGFLTCTGTTKDLGDPSILIIPERFVGGVLNFKELITKKMLSFSESSITASSCRPLFFECPNQEAYDIECYAGCALCKNKCKAWTNKEFMSC